MNVTTESVASIVALRPALEELLNRACCDPESIQEPAESDQTLLNLVRGLCRPGIGTVGVENEQDMTTSRLGKLLFNSYHKLYFYSALHPKGWTSKCFKLNHGRNKESESK